MNQTKLSIEQIRHVLGISYPTALALATNHGEIVDNKWLVPVNVIQGMVDAEILKAQKMQMRLNECSDSGS